MKLGTINIITIEKIGWVRKLTSTICIFFMVFQFGCERPTDNNQTDDGIPPAVPVGVQITYASDGEILIEWFPNSESDLRGYNVYRKTNKTEYSILSFTNKSFWLDDSLGYNETYFYKISAIDIWGKESQQSAEVSAMPINRYKPQKIRYITINARNWEGKISINLTWDPNKESDISGYNIYRGLNESFPADSTTLLGFTNVIEFNDTNNIQLYTNYFYKVRVVDNGGLVSDESSTLSDQVYEIAAHVFPANDSLVNYFSNFTVRTIQVPAKYRIIVQTNEYFGEFWSGDFSSSIANGNIQVKFNPSYLYPYVYYYWRIITYSNNYIEPNSISPLYKFKVKT